MTKLYAYSTDDPTIVGAYEQARAERNAMGKRIHEDVQAFGAGPQVFVRSSAFAGGADQITAVQQNGDYVPEGWRLVRGNLEPRRGKPGEAARQWLADHQPVDVRHVMEGHGLPRASWVPRNDDGGWWIKKPDLFQYDGALWALYEGEPGASGSGFDDQRCVWPAAKLSEYYAAKEAFEAAQEPAEAVESGV